ncbi:cellulose binding domain-containing protein [Actinomadura sp. NBRC 104425]|uniref:cellulose binding domain-containing protein n=1 Tax=Actinomadura sp. NBRC 104425 TaxID=3032204 RepID=UPI002554E3C4|nr:cellulose binding domain-containing protein [Actinomadura sp. NBRC 104425]
MSGHEPGQAPPDHRTTAEFGIPRIKADSTAVDASPDPDATSVDGPSGRPARADRADRAAGTATHESATVPGVEPWTMQFGSAAESGNAVEDAPRTPDVTSVDGPSGRSASAGRSSEAATGESAAASGEEPWTMQFGSEAESSEPGEQSAVGEVPPTPYTLASAMAEMPAAPAEPQPDGQTPKADNAPTGPHIESPSPPLGVPANPAPDVSANPAFETPNRKRRLLVPAVVLAVVAVVAAAGVVVFTLGGGEDGPEATRRSPAASPTAPGGGTPTSAQPSSSPGAEEPAPSESPGAAAQPSSQAPGSGGADPSAGTADEPPPLSAPPPGPLVRGEGITYQVVQQDPGYFEGEFAVTNRTGAPLTNWRITFEVPGANVKNIWGGRLVRGGSAVEIRNVEGARPIPVGATWQVRFGAEGTPSDLENCRVNGSPCGF